MNIHVIYYSKSGHSRKLAQAIAQALSLEALELTQVSADLSSDLVFLITGIYGGAADPKVKNFAGALSPTSIRRVCLITSSMGKKPQTEVRAILENQGIKVLRGEYLCKGSFLFFGMGHPSKDEIREAVDFAQRTVESL